jgi:hypothetical protein
MRRVRRKRRYWSARKRSCNPRALVYNWSIPFIKNMSTIELTSRNMASQMNSMKEILQSDKYLVTISVVPKSEMPLDEYFKTGIHTDEKYGPFTTTDALFASLDA